MNEIKPIKRSVELQPLSREHHDGLLYVWKIRQGLNNNTDIEKLREYTGWYWKNHIRPHFFQEEKVLATRMPDNPLVQRMKKDHDYIRELIIAIDKDLHRQDLIRLADLIEQHIRFEERELFGYMEEHLAPEELAAIHTQLEKHPVSCEEWKNEFWVKKKVS
ncbi:MAG: hemerythrin domain-containing protein [Bacteroidota bacterium]